MIESNDLNDPGLSVRACDRIICLVASKAKLRVSNDASLALCNWLERLGELLARRAVEEISMYGRGRTVTVEALNSAEKWLYERKMVPRTITHEQVLEILECPYHPKPYFLKQKSV